MPKMGAWFVLTKGLVSFEGAQVSMGTHVIFSHVEEVPEGSATFHIYTIVDGPCAGDKLRVPPGFEAEQSLLGDGRRLKLSSVEISRIEFEETTHDDGGDYDIYNVDVVLKFGQGIGSIGVAVANLKGSYFWSTFLLNVASHARLSVEVLTAGVHPLWASSFWAQVEMNIAAAINIIKRGQKTAN